MQICGMDVVPVNNAEGLKSILQKNDILIAANEASSDLYACRFTEMTSDAYCEADPKFPSRLGKCTPIRHFTVSAPFEDNTGMIIIRPIRLSKESRGKGSTGEDYVRARPEVYATPQIVNKTDGDQFEELKARMIEAAENLLKLWE